MHFQGLDLNLLVALDALLSEKNVTRAAAKMHISQPGMSAALQKLRWHLSDQLLERVGRRLELTPKGAGLAGPVKELLFQIRATLDSEPHFDPETADRCFRIAMTSYCAQVFGVAAVRALSKVAPHVHCQIDELLPDAMARLHDGETDFCITIAERTILDPAGDPDALADAQLFTDDFVLIADRDNQAAHDGLTYQAFCNMRYVETRFGSSVPSLVERALRRQRERPSASVVVPNFALAIEMVVGTPMVTIVPRRIAEISAGTLPVKLVNPPLPLPLLDETLVWHSRNDIDPGHVWFRDLMLSVSREEKSRLAQEA